MTSQLNTSSPMQVPVHEPTSWIPSFFSMPSPPQQVPAEILHKKELALDPITTLVQLSLIKDQGSKVEISGNQLYIQPPGFVQMMQRTVRIRRPSQSDYVVFLANIIQATKWYKPHHNEGVKQLFMYAIDGFNILKETYKNTTTEHSFKLCIQHIEQACDGSLVFEKKTKKTVSSDPIPMSSSSVAQLPSSSQTVTNDFDIQFRSKDIKLRFKTLWDMQQIDDIVKRIGIIRKHSEAIDTEIQVLYQSTRGIIDAIVQMQVKRFQALAAYNDACEYIQTMEPARRTNSLTALDALPSSPTSK